MTVDFVLVFDSGACVAVKKPWMFSHHDPVCYALLRLKNGHLRRFDVACVGEISPYRVYVEFEAIMASYVRVVEVGMFTTDPLEKRK